MIIPCDENSGCGVVSVQKNTTQEMTYTPIDNIPYQRMTNYVPPPATPSTTPSVPGTSDIPTATGVVATLGSGNPTLTTTSSIIAPNLSSNLLPSAESVFQDAPTFPVPNNPLLPPGYQEILSYSNLQYMNGFLRTQIGKYIRVEQLIGSSIIEDRYGYLIGVGINYIILQEISTKNTLVLDFYNIKYVYVYHTQPGLPTNGTK